MKVKDVFSVIAFLSPCGVLIGGVFDNGLLAGMSFAVFVAAFVYYLLVE